MDCKYIEQLLERYWQCETSLEEEAQLRAFFNGSDVPEHLLRYKDLFVYQQLQQEVGLRSRFRRPCACRSGAIRQNIFQESKDVVKKASAIHL